MEVLLSVVSEINCPLGQSKTSPPESDDCDAINLDVEWPGEARHAQKNARWRFLGKIPRVDLIEPAEAGHIGAIDIALDHPLHR
jgi:hypothetical protein